MTGVPNQNQEVWFLLLSGVFWLSCAMIVIDGGSKDG
jgi:hypothetical protein